MATGRFRPRDLKCKEHTNQPRHGCVLCSQATKALVDKLARPITPSH